MVINVSISNAQQGTNPVENNRQPTDKFFTFVFLPIFIVWLSVGISGCFFHQSTDDNGDYAQIKDLIRIINSVVNEPITRFNGLLIFEIILTLLIYTLFMMVYIFLVGKFIKTFAWIGVELNILFTLSLLILILENRKSGIVIAAAACLCLIRSISIIVGIVSAENIGVKLSRNILQNSCRVILGSAPLILFSSLILMLKYSVILFITNTLQAVLLSDQPVPLIASFLTIDVIGGIMVLNCIFNFALMVTSEYTVNYYWNDEKLHIGNTIVRILINHIGTIALSSTIVIPYCFAIVQFFKHKRSQGNYENFIPYIITKVFLTLTMPWTALIFSSIYGTSFVISSQKTFDTVLRRYSLYMTTTWLLEGLTDITPLVIGLLEDEANKDEKSNNILVLGVFAVIAMFLVLMLISAKALIVNDIIISNTES